MYQTLSNTFEISKNNSPPQNSIKKGFAYLVSCTDEK